MQRIFAFLVTMITISALPLFLITIVWLVTLGSFNYITAMHSDAAISATVICSFLGLIIGGVIAGNETWD